MFKQIVFEQYELELIAEGLDLLAHEVYDDERGAKRERNRRLKEIKNLEAKIEKK